MTAEACEAAGADVPAATRNAERLILAAGLYGIAAAMTRKSADVVQVAAIAGNGDQMSVEFTESRNNASGKSSCTKQAATSTPDDPTLRLIKATATIRWIQEHRTTTPTVGRLDRPGGSS